MSQIKDAIPKRYVPKKNERKQWVLRCPPKKDKNGYKSTRQKVRINIAHALKDLKRRKVWHMSS
jgi:hypothetical protein